MFALLNSMMVATIPPEWTDTHIGAWTAFHKGFTFSGFDQHTYVVVSHWRPIYVHLRHPILAYMIWPLTQVNEGLKDACGINCAVYVLAVAWTLLSTLTWVLMYKIFRKVMDMKIHESILLNVLFFSFAYIMLVTFIPDHMLLSMTVLLSMLYIAGKAQKDGKGIATWKALLLYFIGTGISTTNGLKLWMTDIIGRWKAGNRTALLKHCIMYLIPTLLLAAAYLYQEDTVNKEEERYQKRMEALAMKRDSVGFTKMIEDGKKRVAARTDKQMIDIPLFEWTDMTIPVLPTLTDNIFGEGFQLHKDHLLEDANIPDSRPIFVKYTDWYNYMAEGLLILLFIAGIAAGFRERFLWMCMTPFCIDMLLHVGMRFALTDVYIMTAHWAFAIPIAIAYLIKRIRQKKLAYNGMMSLLAGMTIFLLTWNLSLIIKHLF